MNGFKEITLEKDVRTFTRASLSSKTLSNHNLKLLRQGEIVSIGTPQTMFYDHRDQTVVQVLDVAPERFIILNELGSDPWKGFVPKTRSLSDIPKDKSYPSDAVQCNDCGGHGCKTCHDRGWLPHGHPRGRTCERDGCNKPIPPNQIALYCSNDCAFRDA